MKKTSKFLFVFIFLALWSCKKDTYKNEYTGSSRYAVTTLPGSFVTPSGLAVDASGNIYIADATNKIGKINANGSVNNSFAGNGTYAMVDGPAASASFWSPEGLACDLQGNIYVADVGNNSIRKVLPDGSVSTIAGGGNHNPGYVDGNTSIARFTNPFGVAVDATGQIYVADTYNMKIRKINTAGMVTTLPTEDRFSDFSKPYAIACDAGGNVYVAGYNEILKISVQGQVSTIGQPGVNYYPSRLATDNHGNVFYTNRIFNCVGMISSSGTVTIIAGEGHAQGGFIDGDGNVAAFNAPVGVAVDTHDNIYVADFGNNKIRKIALK